MKPDGSLNKVNSTELCYAFWFRIQATSSQNGKGFPIHTTCNYPYHDDTSVDQRLLKPCEGQRYPSDPDSWMIENYQNSGFDTKIKSGREIDAHMNRVNFNSPPIDDKNKGVYKPDILYKPADNYPREEYVGPAMELVNNNFK